MKLKKSKKQKPQDLSSYYKKVLSIVEQIIFPLGYRLLALTLTNEHQTNYLRLTIIHPSKHISSDDCEIVSREVEKGLDLQDPLPFQYILEVQSPGIDSVERKDAHQFTLENLGLVIKS